MLLFLFLCNILFIPLAFGTNITNALANSTVSITPTESPKLEAPKSNKTKETLASEGGTIIQNAPSLMSSKENNTIFSYKELGKDTPVLPSRVVPRKGVVYKENSTDVTDIQIKQDMPHKETKEKPNEQPDQHKKTISPIVTKSGLKNKTNVSTTATPVKKINTTMVHKKPLILSYDTLANSDQSTQNDLHIPAIKSSSKSLIPDQMPSPHKENGPTTKIQPMSASRHPGMIMPVVITILVVPMFAVLGYMALRRGQEAWKNRHYKRMDFLLDGMYND